MLKSQIDANVAHPRAKRKRILKNITKVAAILALGASLVTGARIGNRAISRRAAEKEFASIEQFQSHFPSGASIEYLKNWARISKVMKLDFSNRKQTNWVLRVNALAKRINRSPEVVVQTIGRAEINPSYANSLRTKVEYYETQNAKHRKSIAIGQRGAARLNKIIKINNNAIERRKRIITVVESVLGDPALVEFSEYILQTKRISALEREFSLPR